MMNSPGQQKGSAAYPSGWKKSEPNSSASTRTASSPETRRILLYVVAFMANARSGLTSELTDRRALTFQSFKTPRHQSQAQTAVRCSDLVRRRALHTQKFPLKSVRTRRETGPATAPGTITANHAKHTKR